MGLIGYIIGEVRHKKFLREWEENKVPIEIALERAKSNFNTEEYTLSDLEDMQKAMKKGLDIRYCLLGYIEYGERFKNNIYSILKVLEYEKKEGLPAGALLKNCYNGYYITNCVVSIVDNAEREKTRQQASSSVEDYFRKRDL